MMEAPKGQLAIRVIAMPAYTNPDGDIFGGWVVAQMDLAAMYIARQHTSHRVVTVAIDGMAFLAAVHVGDSVCCYGEVLKTGRTSITIKVQTWAMAAQEPRRLVTEGVFTYVAISDQRRPIPL